MSIVFTTWRKLWSYSYKRVLAGAIMLVLVLLLGQLQNLNSLFVVLIQVTLGICIYGGLLLFFGDDMAYELLDICRKNIRRIITSLK